MWFINQRSRQKILLAFTLIELLVVVGIMGVLTSLLAGYVISSQTKAKGLLESQNIRAIEAAKRGFEAEHRGIELESVSDLGDYFSGGKIPVSPWGLAYLSADKLGEQTRSQVNGQAKYEPKIEPLDSNGYNDLGASGFVFLDRASIKTPFSHAPLSVILPPPVITSELSAGGNLELQFDYQIEAVNNPTRFMAAGLPSGCSVNFSTGRISGIPTEAGTFLVSIFAINTGGIARAYLAVEIRSKVPSITSALTGSGQVGKLFSYTISASNSPKTFGATNLPDGLAVDPTTGRVFGTPTVSGNFTMTVRAANDEGAGSRAVSLYFLPPPPVVTGGSGISGSAGEELEYQIVATNSPTVYSSARVPAGLRLDPSTGKLSGAVKVPGVYTMSVYAKNAGGIGRAEVQVTVTGAPPSITSVGAAAAVVGKSFSYKVLASNTPSSYGAEDLPLGFIMNSSTGLLTGIPAELGTLRVVVSASNSYGTSSKELFIMVESGVPVVTSGGQVDGQLGAAFAYQISAMFNPTRFSVSYLPKGLQLNSTTGYISGIPTVSGNLSMIVHAANTFGFGSKRVAVDIPVVLPPVITSDANASGRQGTPFYYEIRATNSPTFYSITNISTYGLSFNSATGILQGTPTRAGNGTATVYARNLGGTTSQSLSYSFAPKIAP